VTAQEIAAKAAGNELMLIDAQDAHAFARSHPAGAYNLPYRRAGYASLAGQVLTGWNGPVAVVAGHEVIADAAAAELAAAGFDVAGRLVGGPEDWRAAGLAVVEVGDLTVDALHERLGDYTVLDVREPYEWRSGVVPRATLLPLSELDTRVDELDRGRSYAVVCASGNRSAAASAWLAEQGYRVANVIGGMALWIGAGHPTAAADPSANDNED